MTPSTANDWTLPAFWFFNCSNCRRAKATEREAPIYNYCIDFACERTRVTKFLIRNEKDLAQVSDAIRKSQNDTKAKKQPLVATRCKKLRPKDVATAPSGQIVNTMAYVDSTVSTWYFGSSITSNSATLNAWGIKTLAKTTEKRSKGLTLLFARVGLAEVEAHASAVYGTKLKISKR